ncbi:hypothetical protein ACFFMN_16935 [Planobispora siamensis]|uniref:Uncharacterized protein n=1 Tax=Planobispora siamensis TaxID=936338 RepID=A0A8J3WNX8_9ACTN|nr:hypothetical protein [Planobispora siamensis]GIH94997.1 hypothetical protein Psi01_56270 [Planobispora siamensis]
MVTAVDLAADPVHATVAVGVHQPPDERSRLFIDDLTLPGLQRDLAVVLLAGTVLGEQAQPVFGIGVHADAPDAAETTHTDGKDCTHRIRGRLDEARPGVGASDHQAIDASPMMDDVSVAEVEAEQVGVGLKRRRISTAARTRGFPLLGTT